MAVKEKAKEVWGVLTGKPQQQQYRLIDAAENAIKIVADGRFEYRMTRNQNFLDDFSKEITEKEPDKRLQKLMAKMDEMNKNIGSNIPYAKSGDNSKDLLLTSAWRRAYGIFMSHAKILQTIIENSPPESKNILNMTVRNFEIALQKYFFTWGFIVKDCCWRDKDVTPSSVTQITIPPMFGMEGGGLSETVTGSGGRTSEDGYNEQVRRPNAKKVSSRMKNRID